MGTWKGFQELRQLGLIDRLPVVTGSQKIGDNTPIDRLDDPAFDPQRYFEPLDGRWAWKSIRPSQRTPA